MAGLAALYSANPTAVHRSSQQGGGRTLHDMEHGQDMELSTSDSGDTGLID
jgi:hypothetical protein